MAGENMSWDEKDAPLTRPRWLTINQLREILPLKKSRIYYLTHIAEIPHHKIGQTLLFREDEILEWMGTEQGGIDESPSHSAR